MLENDETAALCALNRIFGYIPSVGHALIARWGSAAALFDAPSGQIREALPDHPEEAGQIHRGLLEWAAKELERIRDGGSRFIGFGDDDYPEALAECSDPPLGLYVRSEDKPAELFSLRPCIAVVGTRDLSPYGRNWCRRIVLAMAEASVTPCLVSGLAFGADGVAHRTALEAGIPTLGVMATGVDRIYPWQHTELAERMVCTPGCGLVTDYPTGTSPVALNFLRRNRIIAGLALATVVIESKTKGGSLVTAKYANDYNRDVYALPGRLDDLRSAGCNSLIRQRMADIITDPEDLVERLGLGRPARRRKASLEALLTRKYGPGSPLVQLALLVKGHPGITLEEIARSMGWTWPEVTERAGILEADGLLATDLLKRCTIPAKNM